MSMPYYVAPEQVMKDRAEYAQKGIARGRSLVATTYDVGIAIVAENPSRSLHKISEIYDRIAFGGVGKYNEYDQLRVAGVRHADTKGYAYSREDVDARSLANLYAQYLGNVFTHEMKPLEVEILVAELGEGENQLYHIAYEGTITDEDRFAVLGGDAETITERVGAAWQADWDLASRRQGGDDGVGRPGPDPGCRGPGSGHFEPGKRAPHLPADRRRGAGTTAGIGSCTVGLVERRIFGIENEYGVTFTLRGQRRLSPDEVARYLFRRVVSWGRSSNVFLENGARLYLDVGSHPEYATPECDKISDVVVHDKAGEWILAQLVTGAQARLREEGIRGEVYLFKNNTDSVGNSYGCHENYLTERNDEFNRYTEVLIPFLVSRQIYAGAGKVLQTARGAVFCLSQRAEHIWEGVSSATTRSRPIINTRDEPHADAERFRRLHVIVGDSNMSEYATFLKIGTTSILLAMLEDSSTVLRDLTLENPIRAIREISHDITCQRRVRLANGREMRALDIQTRIPRTRVEVPGQARPLTRRGPCPRHVGTLPQGPGGGPDLPVAGVRLGGQAPSGRADAGAPRRVPLAPQGGDDRPDVPRCRPEPRAVLQVAAARRNGADVHGRRHHRGDDQAPRDDAGEAAGCVREAGQGAPPGLHRRLGPPQAERPGSTHSAPERPVQVTRRTGGATHPVLVTAP